MNNLVKFSFEFTQATEIPSTDGICFKSNKEKPALVLEIEKLKIDTVDKAVKFACDKSSNKKGIGTRKILGESDEAQKDGKVFKKVVQY